MGRALGKKPKKEIESLLKTFATDARFTPDVIESFFAALDTPKSLAASMLFKYNEHVQLLDLDVDPEDYLDWDSFHKDYLAVSLLSKADFLKTGYDTRQRAIDKFKKTEDICKQTNQRFSSYAGLEKSAYGTLLFVMRRKIELILGPFLAEEFFEKPDWGPGSSTLIKGEDVSASRKFQSEIGITRDLYAHVSPILPDLYPLWFSRERICDSSFPMAEGNAVTTVPKNSKTDRVIAIEPGLNLWFQKAAGLMIRSRLKRWRVDLDDQGRNAQLSRVASIRGDLATVDFSSASDTISRSVVKELLPERWYSVLNACRCKTGSIDGSSFQWEKFSSMGNGFTFELEALIFFAAALAVCEVSGENSGSVSVYGDDVIIPSSVYGLYKDFCAFLGFTINPDKSFSTGPFRESCGSHWFLGHDVKPLYLKEVIKNAFDVFKLANSIRSCSHRRSNYYGCDRRFLATWRHLYNRVPKPLHGLKIPVGFGDGGFICNFDEATPSRLRHQLEGYSTLHASEVGKRRKVETEGLLVSRVFDLDGLVSYPDHQSLHDYALSVKGREGESGLGSGNFVTLRNRTKIRSSTLLVQSWYDLGPWI